MITERAQNTAANKTLVLHPIHTDAIFEKISSDSWISASFARQRGLLLLGSGIAYFVFLWAVHFREFIAIKYQSLIEDYCSVVVN